MYHAREELSRLRAADYVERNDYAKRDGEALEEAFNASRSMKVMGANLRVHCENSTSFDKSAGSTLGVSARRIKPRDSNTRRAKDL